MSRFIRLALVALATIALNPISLAADVLPASPPDLAPVSSPSNAIDQPVEKDRSLCGTFSGAAVHSLLLWGKTAARSSAIT